MSPSRKIVALLIAAITFVGMSAALKLGNMPLEKVHISDLQVGYSQRALAIDQEFLDDSTSSESKSQQAPVATTTTAVIEPVVTPEPVVPPKPIIPADPVTADAYIVGDVSTGKIYLKKNELTVLPFASMSKIITAIAATDMYASSTRITISKADTEVPADLSFLKADEVFTLRELLYPMLMNSSNVAAEAISAQKNRTKFLEQMSGYAWEIGMPGSYFADPTGLSPRNAGTAKGFFAMARYLYSHRPDILAVTRTVSSSVSTTTDHGAHAFTNIHPFVNDSRFLGGKTGHTPEALDTMLTIMNIDGSPIGIVILHSQDRAKDTQILIDRVSKLF